MSPPYLLLWDMNSIASVELNWEYFCVVCVPTLFMFVGPFSPHSEISDIIEKFNIGKYGGQILSVLHSYMYIQIYASASMYEGIMHVCTCV